MNLFLQIFILFLFNFFAIEFQRFQANESKFFFLSPLFWLSSEIFCSNNFYCLLTSDFMENTLIIHFCNFHQTILFMNKFIFAEIFGENSIEKIFLIHVSARWECFSFVSTPMNVLWLRNNMATQRNELDSRFLFWKNREKCLP